MKTQLSLRPTLFALLGSVALAAACGGELENVSVDEGREAWASSGNPSLFSLNLEYALDKLPAKGEATVIPWTGSYWPTAQDNINYRWDGANTDSPAKKYEKAFGLSGVEDKVSRYHGIDSRSGSKSCTQNSECDSKVGEICAKRAGQSAGRCIPTWFGICHGWTPAAILWPEPKYPVTKNGVTFKINDLKALASLVHDHTSSKFVSLRCEATRGNGMAFDNYGRPTDASCRDSNAGTYHVLLANYLGKQGAAFAEDRTQDSEVWNQPIRGYRVTEKRELTAQEANRLIGVPAQGGATKSATGTLPKGQWSHQAAIDVAAGQAYSVKMTGTGDADLYVNFGAQPNGGTYSCRPYAGGTNEECSGVVPAGQTKMYVSVNGYADSSQFTLSMTAGGQVPAAYVFNAAAKKLFFVKAEVDYISEASSETDGYLTPTIDTYTRTDRYEYVLELDANGKIIGGEWVGSSKETHPDFLWLPIQSTSTTVAGGAISLAEVKKLVDAAQVAPGGGTGGGTDKVETKTLTIGKGAWTHYGPYNVSAGATLTVKMTGSGDADLYVRKGDKATLNAYDCRPYSNGSAETCTINGAGPVFVSVNGYADSSAVSVEIRYR